MWNVDGNPDTIADERAACRLSRCRCTNRLCPGTRSIRWVYRGLQSSCQSPHPVSTCRLGEQLMIAPQKYYVSCLFQTSVDMTDSKEGRQSVHRKPVELMITTEKIDRVLADIRAQSEFLRRERTRLGLVRGRLAAMEAQWRGA